MICISVNELFMMNEWSKIYINKNHIKFLEDGYAKYTYAFSIELESLNKGPGIRSQRFSLVCDNLEVKVTNIEEGGSW